MCSHFCSHSREFEQQLMCKYLILTGFTASLGLEPRQRDPESLVLPLHHEANALGTRPKAECARFASGWKSDALAVNPGSSRRLRVRLRLPDNFRSWPLIFARSEPSCRSYRHRASGRGEKE